MSAFATILLAASSLVAIHVDANPAHQVNAFRPIRAIGTGVDSDPKGKLALLYSPDRTRLMLSTGLGWLTYRLYTELSIEDWHWNPSGTYSDATHREGYWTSAPLPTSTEITDSFGYRLPHRGSTRDQGDDNDYSRIDDGDAHTYWKSNPYLTHAYTHQPDSAHPQWAVVDFGAAQPIDTVRIAWANPYATRYHLEYWAGDGDAILDQSNGSWHTFERGTVENGKGGEETLHVAAPLNPRFIRIVMDRSSGTCDTHGAGDPRNCMGYAIAEFSAGVTGARGQFQDRIVHSTCGGNVTSKACAGHQTIIFVSSADPWHSEDDRVKGDQDQPGLDLVARNRITHGIPVMFPVPLFYSTPDNAAAEVRYLQARRYPILGIEMGEEVDGQYGVPEDYAELYLQWSDAIHRVDPNVKLGGPVFSGVNKDIAVWPDTTGDASWLHRFVRYLRDRRRLRDLSFMSFEHYPYRNCDSGATLLNDLLDEPAMIRNIVSVWHTDGIPRDVPLYITESNFSADGTAAPQRIPGALWTADYVASALTAGVAGVMYYQIEAEPLNQSRECGTWGAYNPYIVDKNFNVRAMGASYYAAQLLTREWLRAGDRQHHLYRATTSLGEDRPVVTAYPVQRPDGTWSLLVVNKDAQAHPLSIGFAENGHDRRFNGNISVATFGDAQYHWAGASPDEMPSPNRGIVRWTQSAQRPPVAPSHSLTVIRGTLVAPKLAAADPPADPPEIVDVDSAHLLRTLRPQSALGSTVDKEPAGTIPSLYSAKNVRAMLDAGYGWLSYRLFTELSVQDWHWNPVGTFSAGNRGYWTSSASTANPFISDSFGYRLPHRGNTSDQGNNESYSRIDDGDPQTFWKSNPYLTSRFTHENDSEHPQWVVVDLQRPRPVNAIRISWSDPYAVAYAIEYWRGPDAINDAGNGEWRMFPKGRVYETNANGALRVLADRAVTARFVRVVMTQSSNTCDAHGGSDRRNCVGYAIDEISLGLRTSNGAFQDYVHHAPCGGEKPGRQRCGTRQTATYVSSVDPWHAVADRVRNQEQPGLDLIARSGLTRGVGATYPVPMLYSTPENAVAELRYLKGRGYAIERVELGEEPDGQFVTPEDYAALYVQWAQAIRAVFPSLKLGGPVFSGVNAELTAWPDERHNVSWLNRFLAHLRRHGRMYDLAFMSFEHYPFDGCEHGGKLLKDLLQEPALIASMPRIWRRDGLPPNVPMIVTEANFSAVNFTQTPMQIEGALWQADYMASALSHGIDAVVYYQYEPVPLSQNRDCPRDWGNLTMFVANKRGEIRARGAQFWAGRMLTQEWFARGNDIHTLYLAHAPNMLNAYALKRPDSTWSLLIVNKDRRAHEVAVRFSNAGRFRGPVTRITFGSEQYVWRQRGAQSLPDPDMAPQQITASGTRYRVPPQSITVLRGRVLP